MTLNDEDIVYIIEENEPPMPTIDMFPDGAVAAIINGGIAMNEDYIEPATQKLRGTGLTKSDLEAHLLYCKETHHDGDFYTVEGQHWTYNAEKDEIKSLGFEEIPPSCKFFSPPQTAINSIGAKLAREYKYDRAYADQPCCQNRQYDSPFCQASKNQADCVAYQPEEWAPVKLAVGENGQKLVWESGRLYSGVPYAKASKDGKIFSAVSGNDNQIAVDWEAVMEETNATELAIPEPGPKNPYLQSLLA